MFMQIEHQICSFTKHLFHRELPYKPLLWNYIESYLEPELRLTVTICAAKVIKKIALFTCSHQLKLPVAVAIFKKERRWQNNTKFHPITISKLCRKSKITTTGADPCFHPHM